MRVKSQHSSGFTLIEAIMWILIGGMVIAAMSIFFGRGITINREQFQQVLTVGDARVESKRLPVSLRNARNLLSQAWLVTAGDNEIYVITNLDDDDDYEELRIFLDGTELKRGETEQGQSEDIEVLAQSVRNLSSGTPVFTYYNSEGEIVPSETASAENVARLEITLVIDQDTDQEPGEIEVSTVIIPRGGIAFSGTAESARLFPITLDLPSDPASGDSGGSSGADTVEVTSTDPATSEQDSEVFYIAQLNSGRVLTYNHNYYVHINYQPNFLDADSTPAGWYAWVGPILVGQGGDQSYYETDKVPLADVCLGSDLDTLLSDDNVCAKRTVQDDSGVLTRTYKPIFTYRGDDGNQDYIRDITYNHTGGDVSTLGQGLVGYWNMEEGGGGYAFDSAPARNFATLQNMDTNDWSADVPDLTFVNNYSLDFDGGDDYLTISDDDALDLTSAVSVSLWMLVSSNSDQGALEKGNGPDASYSITLDQSGDVSFRLNNTQSVITSSSALPSGTWQHVVGTFSQSTGQQKLYVDGSEVASGTYASSLDANDSGLFIGRYRNDSKTFHGNIDDVRLYNRALTASEVASLAAGEN